MSLEEPNASVGSLANGNQTGTSDPDSLAKKSVPAGRFTWEKAIRDDPNVTGEVQELALILATYMDKTTGKCHPTKKKLVAHMGYASARSLERPRAELTKRGYLLVSYSAVANRTFYSARKPLDPTQTCVSEEETPVSGIRSTAYQTLRGTAGQEQSIEQQPKDQRLKDLLGGCSFEEKIIPEEGVGSTDNPSSGTSSGSRSEPSAATNYPLAAAAEETRIRVYDTDDTVLPRQPGERDAKWWRHMYRSGAVFVYPNEESQSRLGELLLADHIGRQKVAA